MVRGGSDIKTKKFYRMTIVLIVFSLFYLIGLSFCREENCPIYHNIPSSYQSIICHRKPFYIAQQFSKNRFRYLFSHCYCFFSSNTSVATTSVLYYISFSTLIWKLDFRKCSYQRWRGIGCCRGIISTPSPMQRI